MTKIVSIIPTQNSKDGRYHVSQGTQVLLSDGSRLEGVSKVTLVAEVGEAWKAIIEVFPTNQDQINALLTELKVQGNEQSVP